MHKENHENNEERDITKKSNSQAYLSQPNKSRRENSGGILNNSNRSQERSNKVPKLATRGTQAFKGRPVSVAKKGVEKLSEILSTNEVEKLVDTLAQKPNNNETQEPNKEKDENCVVIIREEMEGSKSERGGIESLTKMNIGQAGVMQPNIPRPPNNQDTPPLHSPKQVTMQREVFVENEVFLDANDQGSGVSLDSDIDMATETPSPNFK
ncbi:hypothetical protein A2U01_0000124 [Trifolium medium]|uniref:Uncharacterized protein n=1 Tax=Trifolium medium TaxID=97028 RepID=A0A392LWW9_9FABA|nr:hypothetical protein [Trifolium medium]